MPLQNTIPDPNPSGLCMCGCGQPTSIVKATHRPSGLIRGHHRKFIRGHWHNGTRLTDAWLTLTCPSCGALFERLACTVRTETPCCSLSCAAKNRTPHHRPRREIVDNGDGTATVPLTRGYVAIIDAGDTPLVAPYLWHAHVCGYNVYAKTRSAGMGLAMQNVIMPPPDGFIVDHIDENGLNNRRSNLRIVTHGQNIAHQTRRNPGKSGYYGVVVTPRTNRLGYQARIHHSGVTHSLGTFDTPEEAAHVYDTKAREVWGDCAVLNFPDDHD